MASRAERLAEMARIAADAVEQTVQVWREATADGQTDVAGTAWASSEDLARYAEGYADHAADIAAGDASEREHATRAWQHSERAWEARR